MCVQIEVQLTTLNRIYYGHFLVNHEMLSVVRPDIKTSSKAVMRKER